MAEVFSESLAYGSMKKRAVSARSFRVKIPSSNSTSFVPEQTIQIDLPGNLQGQYYNFNQMYLKMTVASTGDYTLDRGAALSLIRRLQISTAGAQIADINAYGLLATAMMDTDASAEWKAGYGNRLIGTLGDALSGITVAGGAGNAVTYCLPVVLNPLAQTTGHRMIPASSLSSIQMRFTLDSAANSVKAAADPALVFSNVEMVCMMTELSPGAQAQIDAATNGKYNILATSFMQSGATLAAGATSLTANLGFSVSSLERIIAIHRPSIDAVNAALVPVQNRYTLGNRGTAGLLEFNYLINSEAYPARPVVVGTRGAENMAELLIADHALVDFKKGSTFNNGFAAVGTLGVGSTQLSGIAPNVAKADAFMLEGLGTSGTTAGASAAAASAATASNVGTFLASTEFESGLSDGKSASIYSGISTIASTVQWRGVYGPHAQAFDVDFFAQFTVLLSLDMRGSGVWSVSV